MTNPSPDSDAPRAWVAVVSRAHVQRGVAGGFTQVCHGKRAPLERMRAGDWLVYYSPTTEFRGGEVLRAFTALGRIQSAHSYRLDTGDGFVPHRKHVAYLDGTRGAPIAPLLSRLHFVQQNRNWGMLARRGHFEIDAHDLQLIARAMGCDLTVQKAPETEGAVVTPRARPRRARPRPAPRA
jgi:hypothetical protein